MKVVYISYDGMLEPLGQSQVLAYLEVLAKNRSIHLLSFEKPSDWSEAENVERVRRRIEAAGIHWHPRRYHKQPSSLATAWDITVGTASALWLVLRHRARIVHARSYVAAVMAWIVTRFTKAKFLFDMRGFWADERVEGGLWLSDGRLYRAAKWFERKFLLDADHVVSLTRSGVGEMQCFDYLRGSLLRVTVIPTCADLDRFRPLGGCKPGFILGFVGTAGSWNRFDVLVECFAELLKIRPDAQLLIINRDEHDFIRQCLDAGGIPPGASEIRAVSHAEVPSQIARMHAAAFFVNPKFSKQASAPTKLAEFLGCGIPCLSNTGVGDMAEILEGDRVGVAIDSFEAEALAAGLHRLLSLLDETDIQKRCVTAARKHFSLEQGVRSYRAVYDGLVPVT